MLTFRQLTEANWECCLDLDMLYDGNIELLNAFNGRWQDFLASDETNPHVIKRDGNKLLYPHKSWVPAATDERIPLVILAGNPATHSVLEDIFYAYEGSGTEHRYWKVLRELGYIDLHGDDPDLKSKYFTLTYESPFRMANENVFTFPSTPSKPKWSGVMGLEKLFGRKYLYRMYEVEKIRLWSVIKQFMPHGGAMIAMQKDAYNAVATDIYSINKAVTGELININGTYTIYGTPPTRWLHTQKMKSVLKNYKNIILGK